jgi:hypothetical protein
VTFNEKSKDVGGGAELTTRVIVAVWVSPPPVPLIVRGYDPVGVELEVPMVSEEVNGGVPDAGLKVKVVPAGTVDVIVRATAVDKPAVRVTLKL